METERLVIRRFFPDDWRDLHEYLSQRETVEYEPYGVFTEEESMREAVSRSDNPDFFAVCLKDSLKMIGNIYLSERDCGSWELGYVFNLNFRGQSYAYESACAVVDDAFKNKHAHRVTAMCNPLNTPSWRLLERLGFRREGHLIKNIYFKTDSDGLPIWSDTYIYAILADEWLKICD